MDLTFQRLHSYLVIYQDGNIEQKLRIILANGQIYFPVNHRVLFLALLFNIYINDIFYFVNEKCFANYADDNMPYAIDKNIDTVLNAFKNKLQASSCLLLIMAKMFPSQLRVKLFQQENVLNFWE